MAPQSSLPAQPPGAETLDLPASGRISWSMPFRTIFARNGASAGFSLARWLLVVSRAHGRERWAARVWLGLMLVLITLLDWYTDREILLATLYLCPILYATLRLSLRAGLLTLVLTTVLSAYLDFRLGRIEGGWGPATVNALIRLLMGGVICQLVAELCAALHREAALARTDALTGLANGRTFDERIEQQIEQSRRDGLPFALAFLDLDHFKQVNDRYGHAQGDALLQRVAGTIGAILRSNDLCARIGGDEFVVILPGAGAQAAQAILLRLHRALEAVLAPRWKAGATLGAVVFERPPANGGEALHLADELLYQGKASGRGKLVLRCWPLAEDCATAMPESERVAADEQ